MYILDKNNTSLLCILCTLMPQIIPLHTLYEESTPGGKGQEDLVFAKFISSDFGGSYGDNDSIFGLIGS